MKSKLKTPTTAVGWDEQKSQDPPTQAASPRLAAIDRRTRSQRGHEAIFNEREVKAIHQRLVARDIVRSD